MSRLWVTLASHTSVVSGAPYGHSTTGPHVQRTSTGPSMCAGDIIHISGHHAPTQSSAWATTTPMSEHGSERTACAPSNIWACRLTAAACVPNLKRAPTPVHDPICGGPSKGTLGLEALQAYGHRM
eukprot:CAMPEP_0181222618 /NCGR_PEP_ID=MMETSP1096-20121128/30064_1 /TAXON_ID=156174 ORGANISM="Chrysochromulina ericina, Strain CCMP281" /NCGR_SAMPLE_ID=MMETSP1096 /ASSEMBLY_ACC=CAM_ASM_000453 /LENGTH=125 /DNA_ID=CAMNT_0023315395 /DNA_START=312 /DNA_END=690 /DNA_ORIENTATION=+